MSHINPMVIHEDLAMASLLRPVNLAAKQFNEKWLQELLFAHPELLPTADIGSEYARLIPLAREFSVTAGPIDLVYVTPEGLLCLAETKLWRNPEAHRTVLAQILDYAKDLTQLEYGDFKARIEAAAARSGLSGSLLEIVAKGPVGLEFDGIGFEQGLRRSLASGNLLLLIVGDRIRPEVVLLSEIVGKTPHLQYTLHLVELQFYHTHPIQAWPVLTIPALVGGTHEVTRAVVKIVYEGKQPDVEVFAEEQESGTNREKTDLETFLKTLTRGLDEVFRPYLERWMAGAYKVYWGSVGFSLRLPRKGKLLTVIEGYPTNLGLFQEKQLAAWGQPMEAYHAYRAAIEDIPEVQRVYTEGRRRAFYDRLSQAELYQILEATDKLVQALRTREGEGAPSVGTLLEP